MSPHWDWEEGALEHNEGPLHRFKDNLQMANLP